MQDTNNRIYSNIVVGDFKSGAVIAGYTGIVVTKDGVVGFTSMGNVDNSRSFTKIFTSYKGRYYERLFEGEYINRDKTISIRANKFMNDIIGGELNNKS